MTGMIPIWHWLKISNDPQPWMVSDPKRVHKMVYSHPLRETYQVSLFFLFFLFLFLGIATNHPDYPHYIPTLLLVYLSVFFSWFITPKYRSITIPCYKKSDNHCYPLIISWLSNYHFIRIPWLSNYPILYHYYPIIRWLYHYYPIFMAS